MNIQRKRANINASGQHFGTVLTFPICGVLAEQFGWEWDFYFFGVIGVVFCILWTIFTYNKPRNHPRIAKVYFTEQCQLI
jgi:predicted MFS family arabinose efflux permease